MLLKVIIITKLMLDINYNKSFDIKIKMRIYKINVSNKIRKTQKLPLCDNSISYNLYI